MTKIRTFDEIRAAVAGSCAWMPTMTSVSGLSPEELSIRLGLKPDPTEMQLTYNAIEAINKLEQRQAELQLRPMAPVSADWREGDWITPVKDQKNCGSCTAFATIAMLEARLRIVCNDTKNEPLLSEAHLFYCGGGNCRAGMFQPMALQFAQTAGLVKEADFSYRPGQQPCPAGLIPFMKINSYTPVDGALQRKEILASKGPMLAAMAVYDDFPHYGGGVYCVSAGAQIAGYHSVCVVGYDDVHAAWIVKNSWGPDWGEHGFFRIGYRQSMIDTHFPFYDVDLDCPTPAPTYCAPTYEVSPVSSVETQLNVSKTNSEVKITLVL
jgi:C1A family cysteine protease